MIVKSTPSLIIIIIILFGADAHESEMTRVDGK